MAKYNYDFDLGSENMQKELDNTYAELEVIVERLRKIRENLAGFTDIVTVYKKLFNAILPLKDLMPPDLLFIIQIIFSVLGASFMMLYFLPLISGFARLPWRETLGVVIAFIALWFINTLKQRFGVSIT